MTAQRTTNEDHNNHNVEQNQKHVRFSSSTSTFAAAAAAASASSNLTAPPPNLQISALKRRIHRLDAAKRRIRFFMKALLVVVAGCLCSNISTILSHRRRNQNGENNSLLRMEAAGSFTDAATLFLHSKKQSVGSWSPLSLFGKINKSQGEGRHSVPKESLQPFGSYPNILNITSEMRSQFHPVIKLPRRKVAREMSDDSRMADSCISNDVLSESPPSRTFWPWRRRSNLNAGKDSCTVSLEHGSLNEIFDYTVRDFTGSSSSSSDENSIAIQGGTRVPQLLPTREEALEYAKITKHSKEFDVGRYDEDRRGMYTSSLFLDDADSGNSQDEGKWRTVHVGIDIGGPVGTKVYAFSDGVIHSAGYNPDVGDYGHVVVVEHYLDPPSSPRASASDEESSRVTKVYALYGHLDAKSTQGRYPGQKIRKGQVLGRIGSTAENGGWTGAHVHFQLAVHPPEKLHDMPGTVAPADRETALMEYLDPRQVLGELY